MTKRHRHARLPVFAPLKEVKPGQAFNPYRSYYEPSVRRVVLADRKLRPGAKVVWLMLADECRGDGHVEQSQANLAARIGLSVDQFQRHLRQLIKRHLVHVEPELGRQNFHWLLWQPIFAYCSPYTPRGSAVGGTAEVRQDLPQKRGTHNKESFLLPYIGSVSPSKATSYRVPVDRNGEEEGKILSPENGAPGLPITGTNSTLQIKPDFRSFWYAFSPTEKRQRHAQCSRIAERVAHFRGYLHHPDAGVARQARHELNRCLAELSALGFYLTEPKGKHA